jgi:hypothetical protein
MALRHRQGPGCRRSLRIESGLGAGLLIECLNRPVLVHNALDPELGGICSRLLLSHEKFTKMVVGDVSRQPPPAPSLAQRAAAAERTATDGAGSLPGSSFSVSAIAVASSCSTGSAARQHHYRVAPGNPSARSIHWAQPSRQPCRSGCNACGGPKDGVIRPVVHIDRTLEQPRTPCRRRASWDGSVPSSPGHTDRLIGSQRGTLVLSDQ